MNLIIVTSIHSDLFYHPCVFYNICMFRYLIVIFILLLPGACLGLALQTIQSTPAYTPAYSPPVATVIPARPTPTIYFAPTPTQQAATPAPTAGITPASPSESFTVLYHPDDVLYQGDQVSIEVVSPPNLNLKDSSLTVRVDPPDGLNLDPVNFGGWGIQGRNEATLLWAWDTRNLDPGTHTLAFSVQPQGIEWTDQVSLLPSSDLPPDQAEAQWATTQTQCCTVYYITNTASERDLSTLTSLIDEQAQLSIDKMGASFTQPITITILPRLLGHGGFTSSEISVSYLDRNYAANSWTMVVHHEMLHVIDGYLGGDFRPTIFVEGLAVYMAGGHYKPEPLIPRAAALLEGYLDWYLPLKALADDFYASQHEIGYLEGASLIEYMVNIYGWDAFSAFYRDIHIEEGDSQSTAIDAALKAHFSTTFDQLEQVFLSALSEEPNTTAWVEDVRLTVTFFDTMRRYQQILDPSAYFRTAWLLDNQAMRERGIVADYLRHPDTPNNLTLETLFITASQQISARQFTDASKTLLVISLILDAFEQGNPEPFLVSALAADYLSISANLQQQGYEVQTIRIDENIATADVTSPSGLDLINLTLQRRDGQWLLSP